jgi:hypothetical protein
VLFAKALEPTAVFLAPDVLSVKALDPTAEQSLAKLDNKALTPIAVLFDPVTHNVND